MDPKGYDDARFHSDVDPNLRCQICSNVLKDPVHCRRKEHHFCTPCITRHLKRRHSCPICFDKLTHETLVQPQRSLVNTLSSLRITCDYVQRGCRKVVELRVLKTHVENCDYAPVVCSNDGCTMVINKRDKEQHERIECEFRKSDRTSAIAAAAAVGTVAAAGAFLGLLRRHMSTQDSLKESDTLDSNLEDFEFPSDSDEDEGEILVEELGPPSVGKLQAAAATLPPKKVQSCVESNLEDFELLSDSDEDEEGSDSDEDEEGFNVEADFPLTGWQAESSHGRDPLLRYIAMPSDAPIMPMDIFDSIYLDDDDKSPIFTQSGNITVPFKGIVEKSKTVGQDGGELLLDDASLIIPRHSLKDKLNIKVTLEDPMPYQSLLRDSGLEIVEVQINHIIKLEPPGVLFDPPASIRVKIIPRGEYLFILHGTRNVDSFIEWEDVTNEVLVGKHGKYASDVTMVIKTFCRYATVRSRFNIPGRIVDSLNCKFQTHPVALFKRPEGFQQCFDTRVVFMTDKVFKTAYESSQAHDLVSNEGYRKCDSGSVKKVYTNRDLDIHCEVFETDKQLKTSFPISLSRINEIGDVFDEFSNVETPRIAKGHFVITQKQKGAEKRLWILRFCDVEDNVAESPKVLEPVVRKEEEHNFLSKGPNSSILAKKDIEQLSKVICSKWKNLARLLNVDDDLVMRQNLSMFPDEQSKAERILVLFNSDPNADSEDLINALESLQIRVPEFLLQDEACAIDMGKNSSHNADINPFGATTYDNEKTNYGKYEKPVTEKTPLDGREIEMTARGISIKWPQLGSLLDVEHHELENLQHTNIHVTHKAATILRLYNKMPGFNRKELGENLKELGLLVLQEEVMEGKFRKYRTNGITLHH